MGRFIDNDQGMVSIFHYDHAEDKAIIQTVQDVEPLINENKDEYKNAPDKGRRFQGDVTRVASIPMTVVEAYLKKGIDLMRDKEAMKKFLNDPDNKYFRTRPGKI